MWSVFTKLYQHYSFLMSFLFVVAWNNLQCGNTSYKKHHKPERQTKWEPVWYGQTVKQTAIQAIIHPDGQTANMPCYCSPSGSKRSAPTLLLVGVFQQNRNNYWAGASGGLRCWLSNRRCRVVTAFCCLSEKLSFTWAKNISLPLLLLKILWHENSLVHRHVFTLFLPKGL